MNIGAVENFRGVGSLRSEGRCLVETALKGTPAQSIKSWNPRIKGSCGIMLRAQKVGTRQTMAGQHTGP